MTDRSTTRVRALILLLFAGSLLAALFDQWLVPPRENMENRVLAWLPDWPTTAEPNTTVPW